MCRLRGGWGVGSTCQLIRVERGKSRNGHDISLKLLNSDQNCDPPDNLKIKTNAQEEYPVAAVGPRHAPRIKAAIDRRNKLKCHIDKDVPDKMKYPPE